MGSEAPNTSGTNSGDAGDEVSVDSDDSSSRLGTTRRGLLIGLTTGTGALGLGAAATARGPPSHAGNNEGVGNDRAAGNNDRVGQGRGPPDQVIVGTKTKAAADEAARQAREVRHRFDFGDKGKAVAGRFPEQARKGLEKRPDVRYVEPDATFEAIAETLPWGVDRIDADVVHDNGTTGDGAHVAIIDTGIDSDHPDLDDNLGSGKAYVEAGMNADGSSCSGNGNTYHEPWDDDNDHGTHCAGTAAGVDNSEGVVGVAPGVTLHAVKALGCDGMGYLSDIAAGVEYTANQGWDVASMSLGSSSDYSTLKDACQYAADQGVLVVAAAGNDGPCSDCVSYPAKYSSVVAVSATDSSDDLASFSSTGPEIDIAAPGSSIRSTIPGGYAYYSGTSMACPHVSGVGGLLMANGYTGSEARAALQNNTEDIGLSGSDSGSGLLDAEATVGTTVPSAPTNLTRLSTTDSTADLTWDAPTDDGTGVTHYNVYLDGSKETEASSTSATVSGLSSGTSYEFSVTAVDSSGTESAHSLSITVSILANPTVDTTAAGDATFSGGNGDYTIEAGGMDVWKYDDDYAA
ncbi:S8 family serine peptidase, partial [Haloplanus aerogenes]